MSSKHLAGDLNYAYPTAEIAVMGPEGAIQIIHRNSNKNTAELVQEYKDKFASPLKAAEKGYIDDIIKPSETRKRICEDLDLLSSKESKTPKRKSSLIPL